MNSTKKCSGAINSSKNKLNSNINWQKISYPNKALFTVQHFTSYYWSLKLIFTFKAQFEENTCLVNEQ